MSLKSDEIKYESMRVDEKKSNRILFVDDDLEILKSIRRRFYKEFDFDLAESAEDGLRAIDEKGPYAVVVSDNRMPKMDGIEFLNIVKDQSPDTVRIMLTGQADLNIAIKAVNEGQVFRFLTKPCPPELVAQAIHEGLKYYQLILADRELHALKKWRTGMDAMIAAFGALIETRDPYTAGHQQRVSLISQAIARELGLDESRIQAIKMAALIHDIGKIYVPAEILNRPGKLSTAELTIIQQHPQVGYDILKPIDFEFPIADIVHQHHETLNGNGYPLGLTGSKILLEAKVITVADVFEAMSSHRPYRPKLEQKTALDHLEKNKNVLYDSPIVDACIDIVEKHPLLLS